jgi:hypothetical protein
LPLANVPSSFHAGLGALLEDVSLLLAHRSIRITERHYLKFDQRHQHRLIMASMVDWHQIDPPLPKIVKMKHKGDQLLTAYA